MDHSQKLSLVLQEVGGNIIYLKFPLTQKSHALLEKLQRELIQEEMGVTLPRRRAYILTALSIHGETEKSRKPLNGLSSLFLTLKMKLLSLVYQAK